MTGLDAGSDDSTSAEMKKELDIIALNFTVQDFRKMTPASRNAWQNDAAAMRQQLPQVE